MVTVEWLAPAAWAGLVLLAVPIAIHLFARTPVRRIVVPSLRAVAARIPRLRRRRHLRDPWLLAVRLLVVTAAVLASAAPLLVTPARRAAWAGRVARAVIVDRAVSGAATPDVIAPITAVASTGAIAVRVFTAEAVDSAVPSALAWLARQPPAQHEIVVVGDDASLPTTATLAAIPAATGIRLAAGPTTGGPAARLWAGAALPGRAIEARVGRAADASAPTSDWDAVPLTPLPVTFVAPIEALSTIEAIWDGVQAEGAFLRPPSTWQRVRVEWPGASSTSDAAVRPLDPADRARVWPLTALRRIGTAAAAPAASWMPLAPGVAAARAGETIVIRMSAVDAPGPIARALRAVLQVAAGEDLPPRRVGPADGLRRRAIERPPSGVPSDASRNVSARDGRWLWAMALVGLVVESLLRRRRDRRPDTTVTSGSEAVA
jgi:hypothetical protein